MATKAMEPQKCNGGQSATTCARTCEGKRASSPKQRGRFAIGK